MRKWLLGGAVVIALLSGFFMYRLIVDPMTLTVGVYAGSYWGPSKGNSYQTLDEAVRIFEKEHPGVKVRYVSGIGTDDYSEWLAEQFVLGREPDLFFVLPEDFSILASNGALQPLNEMIRRDGEFDLSCYYDACREAGMMGGVQYALPYESVPTLMFVNKSLLEEYSISMPTHSWTWDDFYAICRKITEASAMEDSEKAYGAYNYSWTDMLYANDAVLFSEDGRKCYLGDMKVRDAVWFDQRLQELNSGYTVSARDFDSGRVAFRPFLFSDYKVYQPYPWRVKKYSNFEWDCVEMPSGPQGDNVCQIESTLIGMNARSHRKKLAWEFMKLLSCDEELQKKNYASSAGISPLIAVAEDREVLNAIFKDIPGDQAIDRDVIHDIMSTGVAAPRFRKYRQAMAMAENAVQTAMESGKAIEDYLITAQRDIDVMLGS